MTVAYRSKRRRIRRRQPGHCAEYARLATDRYSKQAQRNRSRPDIRSRVSETCTPRCLHRRLEQTGLSNLPDTIERGRALLRLRAETPSCHNVHFDDAGAPSVPLSYHRACSSWISSFEEFGSLDPCNYPGALASDWDRGCTSAEGCGGRGAY
ncbi:hypothetical protein BV25DRAFT_1827201, partial [Artomyces pyxidatus]